MRGNNIAGECQMQTQDLNFFQAEIVSKGTMFSPGVEWRCKKMNHLEASREFSKRAMVARETKT